MLTRSDVPGWGRGTVSSARPCRGHHDDGGIDDACRSRACDLRKSVPTGPIGRSADRAELPSNSWSAQSAIRVAFLQLGGATTLVPFRVGDRVRHGVVDHRRRRRRIHRHRTRLRGRQRRARSGRTRRSSSPRTRPWPHRPAARTTSHSSASSSRVEGGAQYMHRTESGAAPNGAVGTGGLHRDGLLYISSRSTNLGPVVPPPVDLGTTYIYVYDPTP